VTPWPGASTTFRASDGRWENVIVLRARALDDRADPEPLGPATGGRAAAGTLDARLCVAAAEGTVEILELKPSAGRAMAWRDYVNGRRVRPGDGFGP
jgi:methionyl-tRNA formyltransferase